MKKLIRQLKFAYAAETAAYHAYEGHWRSVSNRAEQEYIQKIQLDELRHIHTIDRMLSILGHRPNHTLTWCGKVVGELLGFACFYTGWRLPMWVAGVMEKIGTASYEKIAYQALDSGRPLLAVKLFEMAKVEAEHEQYFEKLKEATND